MENEMLVNDLETMEQVVCSHTDLEWEGWDVVKYTPSPNAYSSPDGVFKDGRWCKCKRYPLTEKGWYVPNSLVKDDA
jgi:hypothetical protein